MLQGMDGVFDRMCFKGKICSCNTDYISDILCNIIFFELSPSLNI